MFGIYKRGQGKWSRYLAAGSVEALNIYGCYSLHEYLYGNFQALREPLLMVPGVELDINVPFIAAFGVFLIVTVTVYLLLNKAKIADFLIETELEMKKISWPARSELIGSSTIVIITVVVLALIIMVFDYTLQWLMRLIYEFGRSV